MDFALATTPEICVELCRRLRAQRLMRGWTQLDLAKRAGVSDGTIKNVENKGQASLESFIRVVSALGLTDDCANLFKISTLSIDAMEKAERAQRQRAPRKILK